MLVSICIPTYTRLDYLKQAVASALSQLYNNVEVCISQDPTPGGADLAIKGWCEEQVKTENRIRYHLNEKNLGLAGNWNKLVELAHGEYIIIMGDDDLLKENFINSLAKLAGATGADVVFSNQSFIDAEGNLLTEETKRFNKVYNRNSLENGTLKNPVQTVFDNSIPMSATLIKKSVLAPYRFDEQLNTPELEVFLQLALEGKRFAYCSERIACYRIHTSSVTAGGLNIDRFLSRIMAIGVPEQYQNMKKRFIASKIIPAINMSLKRGDKLLAEQLLNSNYYPEDKAFKKAVQRLLCFLPVRVSKMFYNALSIYK